MKKRFLSGLLVCVMLFSLVPAATAAEKHDVPEVLIHQILGELGIMVGNESGDLMLDRAVTRAEYAKMLVAASPYKDSVSSVSSTSPFKDVPGSHWAAGYIKLAVEQGWLTGYLDGTYKPDQSITLEEAITGALKLLGYTTADFTGAFPYAQLSLGDSLGLLNNVTATQGVTMTRRNMARLFYNVLVSSGKDGRVHLTNLGHTVLSGGEVNAEALLELDREGPVAVSGTWQDALPYSLSDCLIYRNDARAKAADIEEWDVVYWSDGAPILWVYSDKDIMTELQASITGPIIATSGWQSSIPFDTVTATVNRNGKASSYASIQSEDVIYYSKLDQTIYAYSTKVTGMVEAIEPSSVSPTSVTVAGKKYTLETNGVKYAFSDLGTLRVGDTVTLLLGRTGEVAGLSGSVADSGITYGLISSVGTATYTDDSGSSYSADTITVTTTAGTSATYQYQSSSLKSGSLVSIQYKSGELSVTRLSTTSLSGKFSADGTTFAGYTLAADAEILDTYGNATAIRVYPSRLAGTTVTSSSVLYYVTNSKSEITHLILSDVTGDMHSYGVLTSVSEASSSDTTSVSGSYQYDIGGTPGSYNASNKKFGATTGPFIMKRDGNTVDSIKNLSSVTLTDLSGSIATNGNTSYTLSDTVLVYRYSGGTYYLSSLSAVQDGDYTLTGWYDKSESQGGRIRVIIAK